MKFFKLLLISLLATFTINFVTIESNTVSADDDFEEKYEHHGEEGDSVTEKYEDIGKLVGWSTVIAMGAAGVIFPMRRTSKWAIKNIPELKSIFISISKFFGKYHLFIGIIALALSISHGMIMYISEGELETEGIIGLIAFSFMLIAGVFGTLLFKNKKMKNLRITHTLLIGFALFIVFVHIIAS